MKAPFLIIIPCLLILLIHRSHSTSTVKMVHQGETTASEAKKPFSRLPTLVTPKHYDIHLIPDLKNFTFSGEVAIKVNVSKETDTILVNVVDLVLKNVSFNSKSGEKSVAKSFVVDESAEIATLIFPQAIPLGEGSLSFTYDGTLNDKMKGFYRSKYTSADGKEDRYAAVTQFESTDARRCFPSWDEPAHKATFSMKLTVPNDLVALSNMPEIKKEVSGDLKTVSFDVSPIMSTYLLAVVVGNFDYIEGKTTDGKVHIRVYTPPGKKSQGEFALEVATKALPYYTEYFKIAYPLPKMDLIAISDFAAGAMENWGLVTYRETCLLVDPQNTSAERKQWIALVVAHELAHQWFGNFVTMEWWTHLWLNEGFASFIEYLCVDKLFPQFKIWDQFTTQTFTQAMHLDGLHSSHPIEVPVGHPSEIDEIFDTISYSKGASVIRMLHVFLGNDKFREGMTLYLNRHQYSNTQTEDLWKALEEASAKPVGSVMSTWTKQKGFPCITISDSQLGKDRVLNLSQEKFCSNGILPDAEKEALWMVPVTILANGQDNQTKNDFVFPNKSTEVVISDLGANQWVKLNRGSVGTYRVSYSPSMLEKLLPAVESKILPAMDRLNLHDDLFALVKAGKRNTSEILKLMSSFKNEDDYVVWTSLSGCLSRLNQLLSHTDLQDGYQVWGRSLLQKPFSQLGWEPKADEGYTVNLLRTLIISQLSSFKDPSVLEKAKSMFEGHVAGSFVIPADIRSTIYRTVGRECDEKTYQTFLKMYDNTDLHEEKNRILGALGSARDVALINRTLALSISDKVRSQDIISILAPVSAHKVGRDLIWKFFKENSKLFLTRYEGGFLINRLVSYITSDYATEEMAREIEEFFEKNSFPGTERTVQQSLENIRLNKQWLDRDLEEIKAFIQKATL